MANLRLGVLAASAAQGEFWLRVNWYGVAVLAIGAAAGFFGGKLSKRLWPDQPQRVVLVKMTGMGLAFLGAIVAIHG
ncbi:MAG: hypothetical protein FWE77_04280 [Clostridia bacterium]|nr:hypothetical protein [Clostridia bacterium]